MFSKFTKRKGLEADFRAENEAQKSENDFDICAKKSSRKIREENSFYDFRALMISRCTGSR